LGADDAGVSATDAAVTPPLVIVCAPRPGLEPPLERTTTPAPANTEASATEAPSARIGLLRRREPRFDRRARILGADGDASVAAAGAG
jgi:hypothetical protein